MKSIHFPLKGEHIALNDLLKVCDLAHSGGIAKQLIADGQVEVDGQIELRKTAKIRVGQRVRFANVDIIVVAAP
ncbi:RNA-binding S4 domain-containing protein [Parachitinimonas caeni]|uniref:RNA-binding S4 domain-containing protein n=1 Tax=Parachitinimonas caeni TaxID=3031301 RepID=A0ABT7DXS8_9NEIS|nr:RNA-binding S4 domain-containing protein [Parachitinimonas caeni]MDK2124879.1 RNA-binding S4 domain-containing protein [Parachitinimonas caeni]